jgi:peptide/nickel transport system substrate-binding protein
MIMLMFDGLLSLNVKGDNIPMLASALPTVSSDQLTFTFKLRPNLKWSDGQPITADDVAFTYGLMYSPDTKDFVSRYRASLEGFVQSVTATDPQTVVFKFSKILANFVDTHCRYGILPKHILGSVTPKALNTHDFFTKDPSISSGVFKFVKWDKGQQSFSPATMATGPARRTSTSTSSRSSPTRWCWRSSSRPASSTPASLTPASSTT